MRNKEIIKKKKKIRLRLKKQTNTRFEENNEFGIKQNHRNVALFSIAGQTTRTDNELTSIDEITQEEVKKEQKFRY